VATWIHTDDRTIPIAFAAAMARAASGLWTADRLAVADLRALVIGTAGMRAALLHQPDPGLDREITFEIASLPPLGGESNETLTRRAALAALDNTWLALVGRSPGTIGSFSTDGGGAPTSAGTMTAGAVPVVVAIVGIAAVAALYMFVAYEAAPLVDRVLTREQSARQLLQEHQKVLGLLASHRAAELTAGRDLALNEIERSALGSLVETQRIYALKAGSPLPFSSKAMETEIELVLAAIVAAGLFFAFKKRKG
jgi:hypothetical protein